MTTATSEVLARRIATGEGVWWDAVVLTASNARQAERYRAEMEHRRVDGRLPEGVRYLVVADPGGERVGSGTATILALAALGADWARSRVLLIHSGGDSRRLPQYSPQGKLFGVLPGAEAGTTSVFDETMALSTAWVARMGPGVLVMSGDVVLEFDAAETEWGRAGVTAAAMRLPAEVGRQHGVYVVDPGGRVYTVLQKPTLEEMKAAGALFADGRTAVDIGLLRFDPEMAARLAELAEFKHLPAVDLYETVTKGLTGQWKASGGAFWRALEEALRGVPFHCNVVEGRFTHVGTTRHFRMVSAGGVMDSVIGAGSELGAESVVVECCVDGVVRAGRGSILHGLQGMAGVVEVPENTVMHQVPVLREDGRRGVVIRVYGVEDDPKVTGAGVTWFGRAIEEVLAELGLGAELVWAGVSPGERSLWNARLFVVGDVACAWRFARWMCGLGGERLAGEWADCERMSLQESALLADGAALAEAQGHRMRANWQRVAVALSKAGTDLRPMLAQAPGRATLAATGRALVEFAGTLHPERSTEAASQAMQGGRFLRKAGLAGEADAAEEAALGWVADAVGAGNAWGAETRSDGLFVRESVVVSAPARIDLGGGWSDTPPFCQDWGGTVLNVALEIGGGPPIRCSVTRLAERVVRCVSEETGEVVTWRSGAEIGAEVRPGSTAAIPRAALQLTGLAAGFDSWDGGLEIRTAVTLPVGSGLGTSSILAATVVRALTEMAGGALTGRALSDAVMRLEQMMTTGGGWQDQAGGIYAGAKLLTTGPGLAQKIRVRGVEWSAERRAEFCERLVLCDTGIQRMAKNLLRQVVGSYLARESGTVQVLHSIKTLAGEMAYAMAEGDWAYLGRLLDRHWALNQLLDPHTTNGPIEGLLAQVRPFVHGAKLAGAGGGGFLILLAQGAGAACELRKMLGGRAVAWQISETGLRVEGGGE